MLNNVWLAKVKTLNGFVPRGNIATTRVSSVCREGNIYKHCLKRKRFMVAENLELKKKKQ